MEMFRGIRRCHEQMWLWLVAMHWTTTAFVSALLPLPGLLRWSVAGMRRLADRQRALAGAWSGVPVESPPRPPAPRGRPPLDLAGRWKWLMGDPRDVRGWRWTAVHSLPAGLLVCAPLSFVLYGLYGFFLGAFGPALATRGQYWQGSLWYIGFEVTDGTTAALAAVVGALVTVTGLAMAPTVVSLHTRFVRAMLTPSDQEMMAARIAHLSATRSDAVDTSAAELRRIERDLHDGAQARLVAMGMTLDAAEHRLKEDPEAAGALLAEARASSTAALRELRDLVRGIHPPVLADRGLADAVRSLALLSPLEAEVTVDLPARPEAPVESAVYFAVAEAVTNAAKHADATRLWIDIAHRAGVLRVGVTDDGTGGADPALGSGLAGIERRLATFDGVLAVNSPAGGPTQISMEVPCALSSPKTTSC
ncbi:sensor histidine kinase [Streptomyces sp. SID8379]|uniref:sensor histidine kinase n=1 Tax=unclassified Streptomyces TaxID=2593676 RepID=UPI0003A53709|nr:MULTISPECIES: histidine kinase [unclassified Streptomyces]MYW65753.1 sensor histidine kinase [Streptomyces sp. SID8379]